MQYKSRWARGLVASLGLMAAAHAPAYAQGVAAKDSGRDGPDGRQYRVITIHASGNSNGSKPLIVLDRLDDGVRIEPFLSPWQYTELAGAATAAGFKGYAAEKIMDRGSVIGYVLEPQDSPNGRIRYSFDKNRNGKVIMRVSEESLTQSGGAGGAGGAGGSGGAGSGQ